jgi:hypothetical protein
LSSNTKPLTRHGIDEINEAIPAAALETEITLMALIKKSRSQYTWGFCSAFKQPVDSLKSDEGQFPQIVHEGER